MTLPGQFLIAACYLTCLQCSGDIEPDQVMCAVEGGYLCGECAQEDQ